METKNVSRPIGGFMYSVARFIVRSRYFIFALFAAAGVYCAFSIGRVKINDDITAFLPEQTETRRGLNLMEEEFTTYATARVMITGVSFEEAEAFTQELAAVEHVADVVFDSTEDHYRGDSALYSVTFDGESSDPALKSAVDGLNAAASRYDHAVTSDVGSDYSQKLAGEMLGVILIAVAVIIAVLLLTSRSYFEVVIFAVVFVFAALLNMGTNFWLGEVSSITNSIAIIMQLALAIDYAIIFSHRYQDEAALEPDTKEALTRALARSIIEISSSSLTTISGLVALTFMQFRLGYDLGMVLSKGIICSMLTVFLLMPGLIALFPKAMKKTAHRSLIPNISFWGRFLMKRRALFLIIFALILPFAAVFFFKAEFAFSDAGVTELIHSESREAMHRIDDAFDPDTFVAVLVPAGDYEKEKKVLDGTAALADITSATGLANIEVQEGLMLTDGVDPETVSAFLNVDPAQVDLLFKGYALENRGIEAVNDGSYRDKAPIVDIVMYLFEKLDQGFVSLTPEQEELVAVYRDSLVRGVGQLKGKNYDRLVLAASVHPEDESGSELVESIRAIAEEQYGEGSVFVVGGITSSRDLRESYNSDSVLISILTIVFVFMILLFTFRSPVAAAALVFVIQGSIFINFSFQYLMNMRSLFVTKMIVSAIQMGATIDYAIVLLSRYLGRRKELPKKEAMVEAVRESFPTVITSGAIMSVASLVIAFRVSDVYINHIGLAVGRGAIISVILVLTVLPQLIVLLDKAIEKTTFRIGRGTRSSTKE